MPELKRKKIYFDEDAYDTLKEVSDVTGDGFSIIICKLIKDFLPEHYLDECDDN